MLYIDKYELCGHEPRFCNNMHIRESAAQWLTLVALCHARNQSSSRVRRRFITSKPFMLLQARLISSKFTGLSHITSPSLLYPPLPSPPSFPSHFLLFPPFSLLHFYCCVFLSFGSIELALGRSSSVSVSLLAVVDTQARASWKSRLCPE